MNRVQLVRLGLPHHGFKRLLHLTVEELLARECNLNVIRVELTLFLGNAYSRGKLTFLVHLKLLCELADTFLEL